MIWFYTKKQVDKMRLELEAKCERLKENVEFLKREVDKLKQGGRHE